VEETPATPAGKINLNRADAKVIEAVVSGADRSLLDDTQPQPVNAATLADDLLKFRTAQTNFVNTDALSRLVSSPQNSSSDLIKGQREVAVRALADVADFSTWNVFADIIAQTGRFRPGTPAADTFIVEGESRTWTAFALDRVRAQIISRSTETVSQ
jgi:hypothetical protein